MLRRFTLSRIAVFAAALLIAPAIVPAAAQAQTEQQNVVNAAQATLAHLRTDKEFGNARSLMRNARAVLIVPNIVKAGLFFGGEGGNGVLLTRTGANSWSDPAFYTLGSASFGLQAGVQVSEMIVIIRTERALQAVMRDNFKVGATADLTIATLGSSAEAASTAAGVADIIVWASSSGVYAGLSINGSVISSRDAWDQAYYGRPVKASDIVLRHSVRNPAASGLRRSLAGVA